MIKNISLNLIYFYILLPPESKMELEEYLKKLERCPDEDLSNRQFWKSRLEVECGVYDNWPLLLHGDYDQVLGHLCQEASKRNDAFQGRYRFKSQSVNFSWAESPDEAAKSLTFDFKTQFSPHYARNIKRITSELTRGIPANVETEPFINTVFDYMPGVVVMQFFNSVGSVATWDGKDGPHRKRQLAHFNMAFLLHPYNDNERVPYYQRHRMMAKVIIDLGRYAMKRGLPL